MKTTRTVTNVSQAHVQKNRNIDGDDKQFPRARLPSSQLSMCRNFAKRHCFQGLGGLVSMYLYTGSRLHHGTPTGVLSQLREQRLAQEDDRDMTVEVSACVFMDLGFGLFEFRARF